MLGIAEYFWRLVPANPILLRVVYTASKRRRDLFIRSAYLGLLVFLVTFWLLTSSVGAGGSLADVSKTSAVLFQRLSYLQLGSWRCSLRSSLPGQSRKRRTARPTTFSCPPR